MEKTDARSVSERRLDAQRYLQFDLGNESYAVPLSTVKEVIPVPETTPLPNSPTHYVGIMNLRGQIISVIDLRKRLKSPPKRRDLRKPSSLLNLKALESESLSIQLTGFSISTSMR